jgi:DNA anti-recombination protein RmuC
VVREGDDPDGSVTAYAHRRRVVIVSPNTFYAYLAALAHGLRGLEVEARTREILDGLSALELDIERVGDALDLTGRHLQNAARQQDEASRRLAGLEDRLGTLRRVGPAPPGEPRIPGAAPPE